ncbi:MAG: hypothetical protein ABSH56_26795 [Bryobacteraceae bacterium]|jgi:hypothetical protein
MAFDSSRYGESVQALLGLDGDGNRLMPLGAPRCSSEEVQRRLRQWKAGEVFGGARAPEAALAGLYLYFSCWEDAHRVAQDIPSAEGSYWHAMVHRQEPDAWNSGYWFRQTGRHAIFPALRAAAARVGVEFGPEWDSIAFIDFCEKARTQPGSPIERQALEVQRAEWQLLFDYCASKQGFAP